MDKIELRRGLRFSIIIICILIPAGIAIGWGHLLGISGTIQQAYASQSGPIESPSIGSNGSSHVVEVNSVTPFSLTSIEGSTVTTSDCYQAGDTRTMCFTVHNASPDSEWLDLIRLTFPNYSGLGPWDVSCSYQTPTDSSGSPVSMTCSTPELNAVTYTDNDADTIGEITAGSSWTFCVDIAIPPGYDGQRIVNWELSGDDPSTSELQGQLFIDDCPLYPDFIEIEGCHGVQQQVTMALWNNTNASGLFELQYDAPGGNGSISGPADFEISSGGIITFTVALTPDLDAQPGEIVDFLVEVDGLGASDSSSIEFNIVPYGDWQRKTDSPESTMDNAVAWAVHDGGLWSVGGSGSGGAAQRYDPTYDTWITYTQTLTPYIEYPVDGCYGLDEDGHEVMVLFPDTIITGTLQRFDITDKTWELRPLPTDYPGDPPEGRWAQDIVSLYNVTSFLYPGSERNLCYISGGATQAGGGNVKNLWQYDPYKNETIYLGNYSVTDKGFDFHASWFVPWVGDQGSICVGGGVDFLGKVMADTQCYDIAADEFRQPNVDLGPLPEPCWGMADGWQFTNEEYQIWLANGIDHDGLFLPASAYASETSGGFHYGPMVPEALYLLEGDGWNGQFFTVGGSSVGFETTNLVHNLTQCPECYRLFTPLLTR